MHCTNRSGKVLLASLEFELSYLHSVLDAMPRMKRNRSQMFGIRNYLKADLTSQMDLSAIQLELI